MSEHISASIIDAVRRRARGLCEYCLLPQWSQEATFHIDHIQPRADGGVTTLFNLALACVTCSLKKGSRTHARDPKTRTIVLLYHPRRDRWSEHFRWGPQWRVASRTPTGRATIRALGMNRPAVVIVRQAWAILGLFPANADENGE